MKTIKLKESELKNIIEKTIWNTRHFSDKTPYIPLHDRKFTGRIHVNIIIPNTGDLEKDRNVAKQEIKSIIKNIPNSYIDSIWLNSRP